MVVRTWADVEKLIHSSHKTFYHDKREKLFYCQTERECAERKETFSCQPLFVINQAHKKEILMASARRRRSATFTWWASLGDLISSINFPPHTFKVPFSSWASLVKLLLQKLTEGAAIATWLNYPIRIFCCRFSEWLDLRKFFAPTLFSRISKVL